MENKQYLKAEDVARFMEISIPMAYKIMRKLNHELQEQGFITVAGRVNRVYFESKLYSHAG